LIFLGAIPKVLWRLAPPKNVFFKTPVSFILRRKMNETGVLKTFIGLCKKPPARPLAAYAAK